MALQTINIDDRNYDQLLNELKKQIPVEEWTDHNPSDPGIMLLELLSWLGEMSLYKMNRIPETHENKFLKLVIDPPEPVLVPIELELSPPRTEDFIIPPGIRFATDFKLGKRYIFETFQESILRKPPDNPQTAKEAKQKDIIITRNWKSVVDEKIGISNGKPNQSFSLRCIPVLLDFVNAGPNYRPNPEIQVGNEIWELRHFLLAEDSKVSTSNAAKHFIVDDFDNLIRFGDGVFGAIPPQGEEIVCKRYQVLEGPEALIKAGEIKHILDPIPGLQPGESIILTGNDDAEGGFNFFKKEERFSKGLENFKKTYRLITSEDFENIIQTDFNELQEMTRTNPFNELTHPYPASLFKIFRAVALMNRKPIGSSLEKQTGHVTLLILPEFESSKTLPLITQEQVNVEESLEKKIDRFLNKRRLITTRLHIKSINLKNIKISISVVIKKEQNEIDMETAIRQKTYGLLDVINGYFNNKGWPLGRNVYKSEIYRLIEDIDGVDHVSTLELSPPTITGDVEIKEHELPALAGLDITVVRL